MNLTICSCPLSKHVRRGRDGGGATLEESCPPALSPSRCDVDVTVEAPRFKRPEDLGTSQLTRPLASPHASFHGMHRSLAGIDVMVAGEPKDLEPGLNALEVGKSICTY